jgi:transcriptional regulator with XRE-family HTH domain
MMGDQFPVTKVAAVQAAPVFLDREASVAKACRLIAEAGSAGANLAVFGETWLPGYPMWLDVSPGAGLWNHQPAKAIFTRLVANAVEVPGPVTEALGAAAAQAGCAVVMGINERERGRPAGTLYNTIVYLGADGRLLGKHRKLTPTYTERLVWGRGDGSTLKVVDLPQGRVGGLVCWEHWMPLARHAMHVTGEQIHAALWPTVDDVHLVEISAGTHLATFHMQQSYRLVGRERRETLTGCCILQLSRSTWTLLLFDLGSVTGDRRGDPAAGQVEPGEAVPDEIEPSLGEKIKSLRTQRGMSLRALADRARMSPGFLSEIERDLAEPSVASLLRIAEGLEIPASSLVDVPTTAEALVVSRRSQRMQVPLGRSGLAVATLPVPAGSTLMAHLRTYDGSHASAPSPDDREAQETLFYVLAGRADLQHQGQAQPLDEGDAVVMLPATPYRLSPSGGEALTVLVVAVSPPG